MRPISPLSTLRVILLELSVLLVVLTPRSAVAQEIPQQPGAAVYLQESFDGGGVPSGWSVHQIVGPVASWTVVGIGTNPPVPPLSGTGQAKFNSYDAGVGEQARLTTRRIDLATALDPFLSFSMHHDEEFLSSIDSLYVEVSTVDSISGPWTIMHGLVRPHSVNGWRKEAISLLQFVGMNRVFVSLRGVSKYGNNTYIDEMAVADSFFHDIGTVTLVSGSITRAARGVHDERSSGRVRRHGVDLLEPHMINFSSPLFMVKDNVDPINFSAIVRNFGTFPESTYQVGWRIGNDFQPPVGNTLPLPRDDTDTLILPWLSPIPGVHQIAAWSVLASDSNNTNDTVRVTVQVLDSTVIFSEGFNGEAFPPAGWIVIDRDGGALQPWFQGQQNSMIPPFEGTGFAADNFQRSNGAYLDDYLVTPPIFGVGQPGRVDSLVFRARSILNAPPAVNYPDSLMVLISTTGTDTSDFTTVVDYFEVPKGQWARKQYLLTGLVPQNSTVYVAFRYLHYAAGPTGPNSDFLGIDAVQFVRDIPSGVPMVGVPSTGFALYPNYPNPFNPSTTIFYSIGERGHVTLEVFDALGRLMATLVDAMCEPGAYTSTWNGRNSSGEEASTGLYVSRLTSPQGVQIVKMLLLH